jgi:hypothetical protein
MASRYATVSSLFWIGLIVIGLYGLSRLEAKFSWNKFGPIFIVIALLILAMVQVSRPLTQSLLQRALTESLVVLSLNLDIPDREAIRYAVSPSIDQFLNLVPALQKYKQIPFQTVPDNSCGEFNRSIPADLLNQPPPTNIQGHFDFMDRFTENGVRVVGWSYDPKERPPCIVLLNEDRLIKGLALPGFDRPDIAQALNLADPRVGWVGYARLSSADEQLTAYVRFAGDDRWFVLAGSHSAANPGQVNLAVYSTILGLN